MIEFLLFLLLLVILAVVQYRTVKVLERLEAKLSPPEITVRWKVGTPITEDEINASKCGSD